MAVVKEVCGKCGAVVTRGEVRCTTCGEDLVWGDGGVKCDACGFRNPAGSATCSSCGARLGGERSGGQKPPAKRRAGKRVDSERTAPAGGRRGLEPWQVVSFVAVGALLAILLYFELSRDHGAAAVPQAAVPEMPVPDLQSQPMADLAPLEAAVAAQPGDHEALLRLANGLHDHGSFARAIETYKKYLAVHPQNPDARVDMGVCYYELGLADSVNSGKYLDLAAAEMEGALRGNPTHQQAAFNLGVVTLQRGRLEESNRWFRRAIEINATSDLGVRAQRMVEQHTMNP